MSLTRPTLKNLVEMRQADIQARFPGDGVYRRKSALGALARVMAGGEHGLYGYLDNVALQLLPDSCNEETLVRWAAAYGLTLIPAQPAAGRIQVTGLDGAQLDVTDRWQSATGVVYAVADAVTLDGTTAEVSLIAETAGSTGNLDAGATVTLVNPVAGIEGSAVVIGDGLNGGAEIEDIEALRVRLLARLRQPAQGGAASDYEVWARDAYPAIEQVWVSDEQGPGFVLVRFIVSDAAGGPIPSSTIVDTVDAALQAQRPVAARVTTLAPVAEPQDFEVQLTPDTPAVRAAVTDALTDLLRREGEPSGTILLSHIREAISTAAGETDHELVSPTANVTYATGVYPVMGDITWL